MAQVIIPRKCFRVRLVENGEWVTGIGEFSESTSKDRKDALKFQNSERRLWKDNDKFEIVDIEEDEIMATLGEEIAPRLPGF